MRKYGGQKILPRKGSIFAYGSKYDLGTNSRYLVEDELDNKLGKSHNYKTDNGVDDGVLCTAYIARVSAGGNVAKTTVDNHNYRYDANDYGKDVNDIRNDIVKTLATGRNVRVTARAASVQIGATF